MIKRFSKTIQNILPLWVSLFLPVFLAWGCSKESGTPENLAEYRRVKTDAIELYNFLHPLRCSRIGLLKADSSLFTYSEGEIEAGLRRLDRLLERTSVLTTEGLGQKDIYDSQLVLGWLRGQRFGLADLRLHEINPMLYCWMINEALWGIPSRGYPPGDNELEDYRARVGKLPVLMENAKILCRKPSQLHIRLSLEMLDRLLESTGELKNLVQGRYSSDTAWLDPVVEIISGFRNYIRYDLSKRSHGRIILGSENLAKIFEYDEHLMENPNNILQEADKKIRKLLVSRRTINKSMEGSTGSKDSGNNRADSSFDLIGESAEIAENILNRIKTGSVRQGPMRSHPDIILSRNPGCFDSFRENSFLSFPCGGRRIAQWTPSLLDSGDKNRGFINVNTAHWRRRERAEGDSDGHPAEELSLLQYQIIKALLMKEECFRSFPLSDTLRVIFCGETHVYSCLSEILSQRLSHNPGSLNIRLRSIDEAILDLARMVAVFRLHGGNYSVESAAGFFMSTAGLRKEEAIENVHSALISPAVAYPGLSRLITDDISDNLRKSKDLELRSKKTLEIINSHPALPISFIKDIYFE